MMPTVLERLKQDLARLEERGKGDSLFAKDLRAQIEASEAFPNQTAEQLYRVAPIQMSKDETRDEEPLQVESKIPMPPDEELTEEYWEGIYGPEVAKTMVELGLITPRKDSTKSTD